MDKYFIIKADDLNYRHLSRSWIEFLSLVNKLEIPVAIGLIGGTLRYRKSKIYQSKFKTLIAKGEVFAHGYSHDMREYVDYSIKEQKESILLTLKMAEEKLGISICTFGAPGNHTSGDTIEALMATPISIWLFGRNWKRKNLNNRNFEFEYCNTNTNNTANKYLRYIKIKQSLLLNKRVPGNCSFKELVGRYNNVQREKLIIGQIHPAIWSLSDLEELDKFLQFVLDKGEHKFVTPKTYIECIT